MMTIKICFSGFKRRMTSCLTSKVKKVLGPSLNFPWHDFLFANIFTIFKPPLKYFRMLVSNFFPQYDITAQLSQGTKSYLSSNLMIYLKSSYDSNVHLIDFVGMNCTTVNV